MRSILSLLLLIAHVTSNDLNQMLSPQCFNETKTINDDSSFEMANRNMATTISTLDQTSFCKVDTNTNPDVTTIFCNIYYNSDIPNTIEEECGKLGGHYEEVGIFFDCNLAANSQTGANAARLFSTHHEVPTCTGASCTATELAKYSEQYFEDLETLYQSYNCDISYSDPLDSSASCRDILKALLILLFCFVTLL
ncbi:unnamed protein product [Cylindrotheca closterium]|uniref:Uncharacterized protein n=1 Tax=Cylindrotheca closterium TaxID=2856 RepID=A0AAD2FZP2_9STRA|nr:unnamed protein product [Cylindrotheca closterium]